MKVNLKLFKIEKATDKDERRPVLQQTWLDVDRGMLVATDGYMVAAVPVELAIDDASGAVPVEAIQIARNDQGKRPSAEISANGTVSVAAHGNRVEFERFSPEKGFPDWQKIVDAQGKPVFSIALNPTLLKQLAEAIGGANGGVRLDVYAGERQPIRVTPLGVARELGARGALMPIGVAQ